MNKTKNINNKENIQMLMRCIRTDKCLGDCERKIPHEKNEICNGFPCKKGFIIECQGINQWR